MTELTKHLRASEI